jgi:cell wall-associated NlpC family hydrolase
MSITPEQFVEAARTYLGAPWLHQGRSRQGIDCAGLLICAAVDCGIIEPTPELQTYNREADGVQMPALLHKFCILCGENAELQPGDIISIKYVEHPQHLAIVTRPTKWGPMIIHADSSYGVIAHRLDGLWLRSHRARVHGVFRLKVFAGDLPDSPEAVKGDCGCGK